MLLCPVCASPLSQEETCAVCSQGHSFDRARQGYFNLLMDFSSKGHGDDAAMLRARRAFLETGCYDVLADRIAALVADLFPQEGILMDAGCGEGYYTKKAAEQIALSGKKAELYAFDIAKDAVKMTAGKLEKKGSFFVASTFHIPVLSESVSLIMSLFSPYSEEEFLRVLKPGGLLVRAVALEDHLYSLKEAVYDNPTKNLGKAKVGEGFSVLREDRICKEVCLDCKEDIENLFAMTPYAHKTSPGDMEKLKNIKKLDTKLDFGIIVMEKKR